MSKKSSIVAAAVLALGAAAAMPAHAHFILLKPDSWLNESQASFAGGAPQKAGPCGPGGGDDVQPVPASGKLTTVHVGDVVNVQWKTTVPHLGYFRISLAKDRADFVDPKFDDPVKCSFDMASVPTGAHDNVLLDGIQYSATMQDITIPDMPCEKCTLQVIQVMKDHGPPNCIYYHCAELQILARGSGNMTGSAGAAAAGTQASGSGGGRAAPAPSKNGSSGGCAVSRFPVSAPRVAMAAVIGGGVFLMRRRRARYVVDQLKRLRAA